MAVAYNTQASGQIGTGPGGVQSTITVAFTGAAGAGLHVGLGWGRNATDVTATTWTVTYNGTTLSSLKRQSPAGSTTSTGEVFGAFGVCDGAAHNIVATVAAGTQPTAITLGGISFTGGGAFNGAVSSAPGIVDASGNLAVTSSGTSDLVIGFGQHGVAVTGAASGTQRWVQTIDETTAGDNSAGSTVPGAAGTVNVAFNGTGSADHWVLIGVNVTTGAAGATATPAAITVVGGVPQATAVNLGGPVMLPGPITSGVRLA